MKKIIALLMAVLMTAGMQPVPMIKNDNRVQKLPFAAAQRSIFRFVFSCMDIPP